MVGMYTPADANLKLKTILTSMFGITNVLQILIRPILIHMLLLNHSMIVRAIGLYMAQKDLMVPACQKIDGQRVKILDCTYILQDDN